MSYTTRDIAVGVKIPGIAPFWDISISNEMKSNFLVGTHSYMYGGWYYSKKTKQFSFHVEENPVS